MTNIENPSSRNIPAPIQRAVRQRCGFGCVICGLPLYEYDHLLGWANVQRHVADEITLLCDRHHRERTSGLLPHDAVVSADRMPLNLQKGVSTPYALHFAGNQPEITIGGNTFSSTFSNNGGAICPIVIDRNALVAFRSVDDHLLLSLSLFDENNHLALQVIDNQLVQSTLPWDIQLVGKNLIVREAHRKILLDLHFDPPSRVAIPRGRLLFNGIELLVRPDRIEIPNNGMTVSGNRTINVSVGLMLGQPAPVGALAKVEVINRYERRRDLSNAWINDEFPRSA
jgi:trigger factor